MDLNYNLYLERANNEIKFADIALIVSNNKELQVNVFKIEQPETYYSSVISHAYYCIFYSAKAYLAKKGIKTEAPEEHKKTYEEFRRLVFLGTIDKELLKIYDEIIVIFCFFSYFSYAFLQVRGKKMGSANNSYSDSVIMNFFVVFKFSEIFFKQKE